MPHRRRQPKIPSMPTLPRPMAEPFPPGTSAGRLREALRKRLSSAADALLAQARPTGMGTEALEARPRSFPRPGRVQVIVAATAAIVLLGVLAFTRGPAAELTGAFERVAHADLGFVALGIGFELLSFAGYIALFWLVAGRAAAAIGPRQAAEVSLAGAAATRLLPTGGLGGIALTLWALARSGLAARDAVRTLLTFLILLYAVFMTALLVAGSLLLTGAVAGDGPAPLALLPALFGLAVIVAALVLSRTETLFGEAVRGAMRFAGGFDGRLVGALAWWGFDLAVLACTFAALGVHVPWTVLVLAYFTGALCNTIPLPGLVAGGTTGVLLAFGIDASVALPAVFAYRAIALWMPATLGAFAIAGLRKTVARWNDAAIERADRTERIAPAPAPCVGRELQVA